MRIPAPPTLLYHKMGEKGMCMEKIYFTNLFYNLPWICAGYLDGFRARKNLENFERKKETEEVKIWKK